MSIGNYFDYGDQSDAVSEALKGTFKNGAYDFDYYCGASTAVYFEDIFIDEAVRIGYNYSHAKRPIYGYSSRYYDTVADGQVIVSGQLAINYKENAYLQLVLQYLNKYTSSSMHAESGQPLGLSVDSIANKMRDLAEASDTVVTNRILNLILASLYGPSTDDRALKSLGNESYSFENFAEALEDQYWQGGNKTKGMARNPSEMQIDGFDIHLLFGDFSADAYNHTAKTIYDVRFVGQGQTIQIDGEPIYEVYDFLARDAV